MLYPAFLLVEGKGILYYATIMTHVSATAKDMC
jgi:hypothetical protein